MLKSGARTVVNLTLSTLFESTAWIPAERRKVDEPDDDWKWTLRSAANRPILRLVEDDEVLLVSSSAVENPKTYQNGKNAVSAGDGDFGQGGVHNTLTFDRGLMDGADVRVRLDVGSGLAQGIPPVGRPSIEAQTGYQRQLGFAGASRTVLSYQSHPELMGTGHVAGLDAMQIATAQKMQFGDFAELEAGSALVVVRTSGIATSAHPFVRVAVHPAKDWTVGYRMATARDLQGFNSLNTLQPELPVAVTLPNGHVSTEHGLHQEFSVSRKAGKGMIQASYYRDRLDNAMVGGGGRLSSGDLDGNGPVAQPGFGVLTDSVTGGFKLMTGGYRSQGINIVVSEPLTAGIWAAVEYSDGTALAMRGPDTLTLVDAEQELKPMAGQSATLALKGTILHSRTSVRASYRWQPQYMVTAINPYAAFSDQAYLSFYVRQPITLGWLPSGLAATIDVSNLLEQGYRPFVSADGRTLYLAQVPRTLQAGLAFNF
jgi:hypothetical protein